MVYMELYDNTKTYVTRSGALKTPEKMKEESPAIEFVPFVVDTDSRHRFMDGFYALDPMRDEFDIDPALSDEEAVAEIERIRNSLQN